MRKAEIKFFFVALAFILPIESFSDGWKQTNGPGGAQITALTMFHDKVFAATSQGGVFVSSNLGVTWKACNSGIKGIVGYPLVNTMAVGKECLFIGCQSGGGVFKSSNGGETWKENPPTDIVYCFAENDSGIFAGTLTSGVLCSKDTGKTWYSMNNGLQYTIENKNKSYNTIMSLATCGKKVIAGIGYDIYLYSDKTGSWTYKYTSHGLICSLVQTGGSIIAGFSNDSIVVSSDSGSTWHAGTGSDRLNVNTLAVNSDSVYAGGYWNNQGGVFRSVDKGSSWTITNKTGIFVPVSALAAYHERLIAGTFTEGILASKDGGLTWNSSDQGLAASSVYSMAVIGDTLFAMTHYLTGSVVHTRIYRSTDKGDVWTTISTGLSDTAPISLVASGSKLFIGAKRRLIVSQNGGVSWKDAVIDVQGEELTGAVYTSGNVIFANTNKSVLRSYNNGETWSWISNPGYDVKWTAMSGSDLFAAPAFNGLYHSSDTGTTWTTIKMTENCLSVFMSGNNIITSTNNYNVRISSDKGATWSQATISSAAATFRISDYAISNGKVYVCGLDGTFASSDDGKTWVAIDSGLPTKEICCLKICGQNLFAGTIGSGVWRLPLPDVTNAHQGPTQTLQTADRIFSVCIHPVCGSVSFNIVQPRSVKLSLHDLSGREVFIIADEVFAPGKHTIIWNNKTLPSGTYYLLMQAGNSRIVKCIPVVR